MLVLVLAILLVFTVLLFEFRKLAAPVAILASALLSTSGVFLALLDHGHDLQHRIVYGPDHGDRDRGQERHPAAGRGPAISRGRIAGFRGYDSGGRRRLRPIVMTALAAVAGMLPLALALGAGSQMLHPLAIAVIGGITISMVLSLIITPALHYYLSYERVR